MENLKVVLGIRDYTERKRFREILRTMGVLIVGEGEEIRALINLSSRVCPDLIILDEKLGATKTLPYTKIFYESRLCPVILYVEQLDWEYLEDFKKGPTLSLLVKPVTALSLMGAIYTALTNFNTYLDLVTQKEDLEKRLEERRLIDRAKALLIRWENLTEDEAYRYLREESRRQNISMGKVAKKIIEKYT